MVQPPQIEQGQSSVLPCPGRHCEIGGDLTVAGNPFSQGQDQDAGSGSGDAQAFADLFWGA